MNPVTRMRLAPTLLLLAALGPGPLFTADSENSGVIWSSGAAGKLPSDWTLLTSGSPHTKIHFAEDELQVTSQPGTWAWIQRVIVGQQGSDERPLVITTGISAVGASKLAPLPAVLVVRWGEQDLVAVGITDHPERHNDEMITWAGWCAEGKRKEKLGQVEPYQRDSITQIRVLVLSRVILTQASRDGNDWRTITSLPRTGNLGMGPTAVALGHGWLKPGAADGRLTWEPDSAKTPKDKDGETELPTYRFTGLRVANVTSELPPALARTYQRKESVDDTRDALLDATFPATWRIAGPFELGKDPIAAQGLDAAGIAWKTITTTGKSSDRMLQLDAQLPGVGKGAIRYAAFTLHAEAPRLERFLFDGLRDAQLFVNGRPVVASRSNEDRRIVTERIGTITWLKAGDNVILVKVTADEGKGESRLILRHEPGDPRYRVAIGKRLLADFPPDPQQMARERSEIGLAWEAAGNLTAAAASYTEAAAVEDAGSEAVITALTARARIHAELRDDEAQAADVAALAKAWSEESSDPLETALRSARLQTLLGRPDLAVTTLDQALTSIKVGADRLALASERMRLHRSLGRETEVVSDLQTLAQELPAEDWRRVPLLLTAARQATRPAPGSQAPVKTLDYSAAKTVALAQKHPGNLHAVLIAAQNAGDLVSVRQLGKALAECAPDTSPLLIMGAEAAADELVTTAGLRRHLAALKQPAPDKTPLAELRMLIVRAQLGLDPLGSALLAQADALKVSDSKDATIERGWKAIGPFSNDNWKRYEQQPINPGNPDFSKPAEERTWKDVSCDANGAIDIHASGLGADNSVVFLTTVVTSQIGSETVIGCGADDGLVLWCNGEKIYEDRAQRPLQIDSLKIPVRLKPGPNRITAMVQNGSGGFAFQARLRNSPFPAIDLAKLLAAGRNPTTKRSELASAFVNLGQELINNQSQEAGIFARTVLATFGDLAQVVRPLATAVHNSCDGQRMAAVSAIPLAEDFLERLYVASPATENWGDIAFWMGDRLRRAGAPESAQRILQLALLIDPEPAVQARTQLQLATLLRFSGAGRAAIPLFSRVVEDPALGPDDKRWAREQLNILHRLKRDLVQFEVGFEASNAANAVKRMAAAKDIDGLVPAAQKLIENHSDATLPHANGTGISGWVLAVDALRSQQQPALDAYRAKYQVRAEGALQTAAKNGDAVACERVAQRYPLCSTRGPALLRAAELYRDQGSAELARATAKLALEALAGDPLSARAQALSTWSPSVQAATTPNPAALNLSFPVAGADAIDLNRYANRHSAWMPAIANDLLILHQDDGIWGIDATKGSTRWQLGSHGASRDFSGLPYWETAVGEDRCVVRRHDDFGRLGVAALATDNGRLLWQSSDQPMLSGWTAVSSPALEAGRVIAAFADGEGFRRLVAFNAADGSIAWSTLLPGRQANLPTLSELNVQLAGHGAPPQIVGRDVLWCTDTGTVVRLDAGNGVLQWAATYPRAVIEAGEGVQALVAQINRDASRVLVLSDRVVVAPRDSAGIWSFDRTTGKTLWGRPLTTLRSLAGITTGTKPLVLATGTDIEAIDPHNGTTHWRIDGAKVQGTALVEPGSVFAATTAGVIRLDPVTGKTLAVVPWSDPQASGTLIRCGRSLLAIGAGRITTVGAPAKPQALTRATRDTPLISTGLTQTPGGPTLGLVARWEGGPIESLLTPDTGADRYVQSHGFLARIESGAAPKLLWQKPIPSALRGWGLTKSAVVGIAQGAVTLIDRTTGEVRATVGTAPGPEHVLSDVFSVWPAADGITCFRWSWGYVSVLDPTTGATWQRAEYSRGIAGAQVVGDRLIVVRDGDGGIFVEERNARTGSESKAERLPFNNFWELRIFQLDAKRWILGGQGTVGVLDLTTRVFKPYEGRDNWTNLPVVAAEVVGDRIAVYRENWQKGFSLIWNAEGKITFEAEHVRVKPGFATDRVLLQNVEKNVLTLLSQTSDNKTTQWRWDYMPPWECTPKALIALGQQTAVISQRQDSVLRWNLLGPDGKPQSEGILPGQSGSKQVISQVGSQLWVGTSTGLAILAPASVEAVAAVAPAANQPIAERATRDFATNGTGKAQKAFKIPITVDGDLAEWPDEHVRTAGIGAQRQPTTAGNAMISGMTLRSAWDDRQVTFAIEVEETTGAPISLRLGLDTRPEGHARPPTQVFDITQVAGRSAGTLIDGAWTKGADAGDLEPVTRAVQTLTGWHFEIGIPWPVIRERAEWRPGDRRLLRLGVLAEAPGAAVEIGHGLATGIDWCLWPTIELTDEQREARKRGTEQRER